MGRGRMTTEGFTFPDGPLYGTLDEANVALARENLVGKLWNYKANGLALPRVGDRVVISLEGGVDLIARVDEVGDGFANGVIVDAVRTPFATDWDEDGNPIAWDA